MIKIDKGVPLPPVRQMKYPWHDMAVGDSFLMEGKTIRQAHVGEANKSYAPKRFAGRTVEDGVRVWRVE